MPPLVADGTPAGDLWAVVPILPTLGSLLVLLPALILSGLTAAASWLYPATAGKVVRLAWRQRGSFVLLGICAALVIGSAVLAVSLVSRSTSRNSIRVPPVAAAWRGFAGNGVTGQGAEWTEAAWTTDRGGLQRLGAEPTAQDPTRPELVWKSGGPGEAFYASPAIVGDRLFMIGSQGDRGTIHGYDTNTGQRLWSCRPPGMRATFSSPVVSDGYLVCGEGLHHTRNARVICVDLRSRQVAWTFATRSHVECTPVIWRQRVYVGAGDDGIYCLQLDPAAGDAQRMVWHQPGARCPDAETSLAVHDGRVYAGLGVGGQALCVLDAATGELVQRIELPYPVFSPPSISLPAGRLFVGMGVGDYVTPADTPAGQVCGFDLDTLQPVWTFRTPASVLGAVAVADDRLIFGCWDGRVYQLDLNGQLLASWDCGAPLVGSPAVGPNCVYVVNQQGMLDCLDRRQLRPLWRQRLGSQGRFISSPVLAQGSVFVGTERHGLLRIGRRREEDVQPLWPGHLGGSGHSGCRDGSTLPAAARVAWQWTLAAPDRVESAQRPRAAPVAVCRNSVLVPVAAGPHAGLVCLEVEAGPGERPRTRWSRSEPLGVHQSAAIVGAVAILTTGRLGEAGRALQGLDLETGKLRWRRSIGVHASGVFLADRHGIVVQDRGHHLSHWDLDGQPAWSLELGQVAFEAAADASRLLVAVARPPALLLLDRPTGRTLWRVTLDEAATAAPVFVADRVYVGTRLGLEIRSLLDGRILARSPKSAGGVASPLALDRQRLAFVNDRQRMIVCSADDARMLAEFPDVLPGSCPLVTADRLVMVGRQSLLSVAWPTVSDEPTAWCPWIATDKLSGPLVLHEGRVFLEVVGRGLLCLQASDPS